MRVPWLIVVIAAGMTQTMAPPATEIFLASLSVEGDKVVIGAALNISNNPGYDNQPSFTPEGSAIVFTSVRGDRKPDPANSAAIGSDVYRYDIQTRQVSRVTNTPESEYSPTVTPDGKHISVVRVEAARTQRLWRFTLEGTRPELVLAGIEPVGYHAWADADTLALFVLGEPATLQVADVRTGKGEIVARDIGRSLQRMPDGGISYVQREPPGAGAPLTIMRLDAKSRTTSALVAVPDGITQPDLAWTPGAMLVMAHAGKLYGWRRGAAAMGVVADLDALGLEGVTRMAVSPGGDRIALVVQEGS